MSPPQKSRILGDEVSASSEFWLALTFDDDLAKAHADLAKLRMPGDNYLVWLERFHKLLKSELYLEIGISRGKTLSLARPPTRAVGIDPEPKINAPFKAETHIFCEASDSFFDRSGLEPLRDGRSVDLAFVDGLHVFEQSLRDFINVEKFCGRQSVVLIHDTVPFDEMTQRPDRQRTFYTGDVWKTVVCLKHYRSDLETFTIATPPTGLTVVICLDASSRTLDENYDAAAARFNMMPYAEIENVLNEAVNIVPNEWREVAQRLEKRNIL